MSDSFGSSFRTTSFIANESAIGDEEVETSGERGQGNDGRGGETEATAGAPVFVSPGASVVVKFSVADTGCGISSQDQAKLFEAFSQLRAGDLQSDRGSGLGMSLSKHLVEFMGGTIKVQSQPGKGSTFSCTVWTIL